MFFSRLSALLYSVPSTKRKKRATWKSSRNRLRRLMCEPLEPRLTLSTLPAGFQETLIGTNVNPGGFDFAPDSRMFIANKDGRVTIIKADGTTAPQPFFTVPVDTYRDRGLTAVVVDPNYALNHYVYVYYTAAVAVNPNTANNGAMNRLVRLTASNG